MKPNPLKRLGFLRLKKFFLIFFYFFHCGIIYFIYICNEQKNKSNDNYNDTNRRTSKIRKQKSI